MENSLFQLKDFVMHSGERSSFKIECDSLTDADIEALAHLISQECVFSRVQGIPRGGNRIAAALEPYTTTYFGGLLIVDDVYTTGFSMEEARVKAAQDKVAKFRDISGVVLFARRQPPEWIRPVFQLWG